MTVRIGVAGAGLAGAQHIAAIERSKGAMLAGIADPSEPSRRKAADAGVPWFPAVEELIAAGIADGIILATPNHLHGPGGLACIAAGLPVLIEKPLSHNAGEAETVVSAAEAAGVPLLAGHHRRHNPIAQEAKRAIDSGRLGSLTALHAHAWLMKPDRYFREEWRTKAGGGPVFVNLVHDMDLLQYFCGPISSVHAMESNAYRGFAVEDTAVILLRFASGLLGTVNVSDAAVAPWSWELTAHENPAYDKTNQNCYWIAGSAGSLAIPRLAVWRYEEEQSWWQPIRSTELPVAAGDSMDRQIEHFARVIRRKEQPLVSGADGLAALRVIEAIKRSASEGTTIHV